MLLEGAPEELDVREIGPDLVSTIPAVRDVHHVHAWSLSQDWSLITLHAQVVGGADPDLAVQSIRDRLAKRFNIRHSTVQIGLESCADGPVPACG